MIRHFLYASLGLSSLVCCAQKPPCTPPTEPNLKIDSPRSAASYDELGLYFEGQNSYLCAINAFRSSLQIKPASWQTRYYLGSALLANGDAASAVRELRLSLHMHPNQPEAHLRLGLALGRLHQVDAAIGEFCAVLASNPQSIPALDWLAKTLISQSRYIDAIALLKDAPVDETLHLDLAVAYSKNGDNDKALRLFSEITKRNPSLALAHSEFAAAYARANRLEDAAAEFRHALLLDPQDDAAQISYAKLLILLSDFATASPILRESLKKGPKNFEALDLMGTIDRQMANYSEAKNLLTQAIRLKPEQFDPRYNLGLVLFKQGERSQARLQMEKALRINPSSSEARFQLAAILRAQGLNDLSRKQLALYQADRDRQASRDMAASNSNQAAAALARGDLANAIALYKDAVQANPGDSRILYNLALALDRNADYQQEREILQRAIELDPKFTLAHNQLGFLHLQAADMANAEKEFKAAIACDPHYAEAQNNLGSLYGEQGRDGDAERLFRQAVENNPLYAQAFVNLGVTLASQSRLAEAMQAVQSALRIEPDNKDAVEINAKILAMLQSNAAK